MGGGILLVGIAAAAFGLFYLFVGAFGLIKGGDFHGRAASILPVVLGSVSLFIAYGAFRLAIGMFKAVVRRIRRA